MVQSCGSGPWREAVRYTASGGNPVARKRNVNEHGSVLPPAQTMSLAALMLVVTRIPAGTLGVSFTVAVGAGRVFDAVGETVANAVGDVGVVGDSGPGVIDATVGVLIGVIAIGVNVGVGVSVGLRGATEFAGQICSPSKSW